jgi:hypothetical protein
LEGLRRGGRIGPRTKEKSMYVLIILDRGDPSSVEIYEFETLGAAEQMAALAKNEGKEALVLDIDPARIKVGLKRLVEGIRWL